MRNRKLTEASHAGLSQQVLHGLQAIPCRVKMSKCWGVGGGGGVKSHAPGNLQVF